MKLLLHIGTEKTGSSYLQTLMALNREQLQQASIYFPKAGKREQQMIQGEISPGNAQDLSDGLLQNDEAAIHRILENHQLNAMQRKCRAVLLSNELLVAALSEVKSLETFLSISKAIGFQEIKMLLFLRDPIDQALSLYKHRAKSGTISAVEDWIVDSHTLPVHLQGFLGNVEKYNLSCAVRKYSRKEGYMAATFFREWLEIDMPSSELEKSINPSLSISELLFIKKLKAVRPALVSHFYQRMLDIPKAEKATESRIERYYRKVLERHLSHFEEIWVKCNQYLPQGEKLSIPEKANEDIPFPEQDKVLTFSETQADEIAHLMAHCLDSSLRWQLQKRKLRNQLSKVKALAAKYQ